MNSQIKSGLVLRCNKSVLVVKSDIKAGPPLSIIPR